MTRITSRYRLARSDEYQASRTKAAAMSVLPLRPRRKLALNALRRAERSRRGVA